MNNQRWTQSDNYWSSTTNADNTDNAWNVNFNNGNVNNDDKTNTNYVRAVRGGQCRRPSLFFQ
ncbi:MAG TPA: DUF1566 domain-containing protein [Syntrophales bacterium]|nr:DUF1566 domain-containing protein [Syntrophales bacterium]